MKNKKFPKMVKKEVLPSGKVIYTPRNQKPFIEGKKVIPCLKRTTKKAIVSTKKSYPYK